MSEGVEWGIHCCALLAVLPDDIALPASRLAEFHGVPAAYLAKHLQALSAAGIVESGAGRRGGYRLARHPRDISLLDVVDAIDGDTRVFRCSEIRQRGPAALDPSCYRKACGIARAMWAAEQAWRDALAQQTIADLLVGLANDVPSEAAVKAAAWLQEVSR
ncbi:MAG TPA: Rrf2 family transcriptional regulator [Acidimicrobiales bacterium]